MENMDKEEAAFKVAARHHDFLEKATHEYMELTGQISKEFKQKIDDMCNECLERYQSVTEKEITCQDIRSISNCIYPSEITSDDSFRAARKEMLGLLKDYRHPLGNGHSTIEYEIFFGDTNFDVGMVVPPRWIRHESLLTLPDTLRKTIHEYAIEAETDKYRLRRLRKETEELRELINTARKAYKKIDDNDDSHSRNVRVVQALGLSSGKKGNRSSIDHRGAYEEYVRLVRNKEKSPEEALKSVQQDFGYNSIDSARNSLYDELRKVKDWWYAREGLDSVLYNHYAELGRLEDWVQTKEKAEFLENYWNGLIYPKQR